MDWIIISWAVAYFLIGACLTTAMATVEGLKKAAERRWQYFFSGIFWPFVITVLIFIKLLEA